MQRNEIELFNNTYQFLLVHNYVNYFLTGGVSAMEQGDASGTGLWDPVKRKWSENLTNVISDDLLSKLPSVSSSIESIGYISKELVKSIGFDSTCKIDAGSGDNMYGAIGTETWIQVFLQLVWGLAELLIRLLTIHLLIRQAKLPVFVIALEGTCLFCACQTWQGVIILFKK